MLDDELRADYRAHAGDLHLPLTSPCRASPKEIAALLGKPLGTVSFHVAELVADGAIELVRTEPRRGAVEHHYRAKVRPEVSDAEFRRLPTASRRKLAALALQAIVAEGLSALRHGKMDADDDLNLIWMPMKLDGEGRDEVDPLAYVAS